MVKCLKANILRLVYYEHTRLVRQPFARQSFDLGKLYRLVDKFLITFNKQDCSEAQSMLTTTGYFTTVKLL